MKSTFTVFGKTPIGCEFVVTGGNPIVVKNNGTPAKEFTEKKANQIARELRSAGDIINIKSTSNDTSNPNQ